MIVGLDCATPQLVFERWKEELTVLSSLMDEGGYGPLRSTIPPITCPAWMSMVTGKDPGELGVYGFRNRKDYSYSSLKFVTSRTIKEDTLWDMLGRKGKRSIVLGVPQTYPPKRINGYMVTGILTPGIDCDFTYPRSLKREIQGVVGEYIIDADITDDKHRLLETIYEMTQKRFKLADYLLTNKNWDFFMMVEMGIDRIQHHFWKFFDREHPEYEPGTPFEDAVKDYYKFVDRKIGEILKHAEGDTLVLIVSDHGAQRMEGGIAVNEWLMEKGYLVLKQRPEGIVNINQADIDWSRTRAWGYGGYYSRIFMNVKGREPEGVIPPSEYETFREQLARELKEIRDNRGNDLETRVFKPEDVYVEVNNIPPDLMVYFGNLRWRAIGSIGHNCIHVMNNDAEDVNANHYEYGIYISSKGPRGRLTDLDIKDVAPTVLDYMGVKIPEDIQGKIIK